MNFGESALLDPKLHPKVKLIYNKGTTNSEVVSKLGQRNSRRPKYYSFDLLNYQLQSGDEVDASEFKCIFDTGTPVLQLPSRIFNELTAHYMANPGTDYTVMWNFKSPTGGATPLKMTFPAGYVEAITKALESRESENLRDLGLEVGVGTEVGECIWGISTMRFLEQITADFSEGKMYFQAKVRKVAIHMPYS